MPYMSLSSTDPVPFSPSATCASLIDTTSGGNGSTGTSNNTPGRVSGRCTCSAASSSECISTPRCRGLIVDERKRCFVLHVKVGKSTCSTASKCLSSISSAATRSGSTCTLSWRQPYCCLTAIRWDIIPVCKSAKFIRFRIRGIRDVFEFELIRKIWGWWSPAAVWIVIDWW